MNIQHMGQFISNYCGTQNYPFLHTSNNNKNFFQQQNYVFGKLSSKLLDFFFLGGGVVFGKNHLMKYIF